MEAEKTAPASAPPPTRPSSISSARSARRPPPSSPRHPARLRPDPQEVEGRSGDRRSRGGRCTACQIILRPQYMQDLKRGEELMFCESCGRFLYYNPPVHVEDGTRLAM